LIEWLYDSKVEVVGHYSVPNGGTGRIYRVPFEELRRSLDDVDAGVVHDILGRSVDDAGRGGPDAIPSR
jgi:hypothetical protein